MRIDNSKGYLIDFNSLPKHFPTHRHNASFWESLGRVVATFGFLEETLAKAIFSFTATKEYSEEEIDEAFSKWIPKLERTLSDPLGNLIDTYGKAVRDNPNHKIEKLESFLTDLRSASKIRNVLCHGSWRPPNSQEASVPFFINRQNEVFETAIDIAFLEQTQLHVCDLASSVMNSVTHMGWQFPGSNGPGEIVWNV